MSGGVDSSVAALCLRDAGYDVAGITMRLKPRHMLNDAQAAAVEKEIADAAAVCAKLGIEHFAPDFSAAFEKNVIGAFVSAYKNGETPNPCFRCNQTIKFGVMLDWALAHGFDKIATGHYAEIVEEGGRTKLKRSPDQKDQSYFLSGLTPAQLSRTLLPLNRMGKAETRALAQQHGLPVAQKPDSQEICFIPDHDYARFIEENAGEVPPEGNFVDWEGHVLGRHRGIIHYTVGQRKGLNLSMGRPVFVTAIRPETNEVVIGDAGDVFTDRLVCGNVNWMAMDGLHGGEARVKAKIRYSHKGASCRIREREDGLVECVFDEPQRAVTPGQAVVFYQGDYVAGGGTIL